MTTHSSSEPYLLIENLDPMTEYVVEARVTKLKDLAMIYPSTEYSTPINATSGWKYKRYFYLYICIFIWSSFTIWYF